MHTHLLQNHDGKKGRTESLRCPVSSCHLTYESRPWFETHLNEFEHDPEENSCPLCHQGFKTWRDRENHLAAHESQEDNVKTEPDSETDSEEDLGAVQELKRGLTVQSGSLLTADYMISIAQPIVLTLDDDSKISVLGGPGSVEALAGRTIVQAKTIQHGERANDPELSNALLPCRYGKLVLDDLSLYHELDTNTCQLRFSTSSKEIGRRLAGALIQSRTSIMLVLKAEPYGVQKTEDPHEQTLVIPDGRPYIAKSVKHDSTQKLIVATDRWQMLVTSCILLNTGEVTAGPHVTSFTPHRNSRVWTRADFQKNLNVERHLRSKFHDPSTLAKCAGIFHAFQRYTCQPVTLGLLYEYYIQKSASGTKVLAYIFHNFFEDEGILKKSVVQEGLAWIKDDTSRITQELRTLESMILNESGNDVVSITGTIGRQLRVLAGMLPTAITDLNQKQVKKEIERHIERLLNVEP
ncbi:hypothetical protein EMPS_06937 [Entomortierella parvispora]|uniref:C2H2-type domain-containing protein n=1 Tax=Entomortierella parvispora TaxID=205924 RepID=A0A9P3HDC7_9FUNG|nr:hypothetical protein EMPS_06937 [Entomortierella parvispora]